MDGPVQAFAAELRALRAQAGNPKYLQMARRAGRSRTALAEAAGGDHLPTWETVEAYVMACGADPAPWRIRWDRVDRQLHPQRDQQRPPIARPDTPPAQPVRHERRPEPTAGSRPALVGVLTALAVVYGPMAAMTVVAMVGAQDREAAIVQGPSKSVQIADGVAAPLHLSTGTSPCTVPECRIPGLELRPGDHWTVSCYIGGARMEDPNGEAWTGWYGEWRDGRVGYVSEVHVSSEFRGNPHGLGPCPGAHELDGMGTPGGNIGRRLPS